VNAISPSISKCFHLLGLASDMTLIAVLYIATGGRPLKMAVEFDSVGRIEVDALHFTAQPFALGQARHDL
jgi:hypothetical protein